MPPHSVAVTNLFIVEQREEIIAHLRSFDWDSQAGPVRLRPGDDVLSLRQVGSGNHEGHAVVILRALGSWDDAIACVGRIHAREGAHIVLERERS